MREVLANRQALCVSGHARPETTPGRVEVGPLPPQPTPSREASQQASLLFSWLNDVTFRRFEALENKLEGLVAQLSEIARQKEPSTGDGSPESSGPSVASSRPGLGIPSSVLASSAAASSKASLPWRPAPPASSDLSDDGFSGELGDAGLLDLRGAEETLQAFKNHYVPHCPFVAIHPAHTIESVRADYPMTFFAIMAVTGSHSPRLQGLLGEKLRRQLYSRIALNGEASFDLLRALLIYAAWYQYFFDRHKPQVFLLVQLCITLVHELGLEKRPAAAAEPSFDHNQPVSEHKGGSEGKRLLLGVYWYSARYAWNGLISELDAVANRCRKRRQGLAQALQHALYKLHC